ncbi:hypothetical protein [Pseudomonas frederiksbergensis]|uniref:Uncharacterized protein n=1 Tax=Pseudomonas frederiksbergensis TaxID=104087 RepID=A0A423K587_9PSED|nr:hypothetical protein [Pseudomonas frederiksbergensis]RON46643.1 hypothetical protein BK665_28705 [Pseudomonas frederiksbergensis]
MFRNINGKISCILGSASKPEGVSFESTDLSIDSRDAPEDYVIGFDVNKGSDDSHRRASFVLLRDIATGPHVMHQGASFSSAGYSERAYEGATKRINQYSVISGVLEIVVTDISAAVRKYDITGFSLSVKSDIGNAPAITVEGKFEFYIRKHD